MFNRTPKRIAKLATSIAFAGAITGASGAAALAQDATPGATPIGPEGAACMAPALTATPFASPTGATPVTNESELPEGTVVEDQAVIDEATAAIENLYACFNAGDGSAVVALFTPTGLDDAYGAGSPGMVAEQVSALASAAQAGNIEVHEVVSYDDGRLGVDYQVTIGQQTFHFTDVLVQQDGTWKVDERRDQLPETELDATTAGITTSVEDGSLVFEVAPNPILSQPAVKFQLANEGEQTHYLKIFKAPEGVDGSTLVNADLRNLPEGVSLVGQDIVDPGEFSDTLFEGLEEGRYVVVGSVVNTSGESTGVTGWTDITIDPPFDPNA